MGVLVRVNHELDAAFNTMLLLAFTNLVENSVDYFINPVFTDVNNGINKAMLHVLIIRINLCSCCYLCCITLYYNCIDYLLDETHVRVHFGYSGNLFIDFCICDSKFRSPGLPNRGFRMGAVAKIDCSEKSCLVDCGMASCHFLTALGAVFLTFSG